MNRVVNQRINIQSGGSEGGTQMKGKLVPSKSYSGKKNITNQGRDGI